MSQLFISHSHKDVACAEQIRHDLEAAGYAVWKDTQNIAPGSPSYVRVIEMGIRGSVATIVVWSERAATSEWVERELLYSQQLKKPIYPVHIDDTTPGILLVAAQHVRTTVPCTDAVHQLLSSLPDRDEDDALHQTSLLLAHPHIAKQKEGIQRAADLLAQGRHREELLAVLEDIARRDLYLTVRDAARGVIEAETKQEKPPMKPEESRHIFPVRCPDGHVTYFDRNIVCSSKEYVYRDAIRGGREVSELLLTCETCGKKMIVPVDCEGYK